MGRGGRGGRGIQDEGAMWCLYVVMMYNKKHHIIVKVIILQLKFKNKKRIYEKMALDTEMKIFTLTIHQIEQN